MYRCQRPSLRSRFMGGQKAQIPLRITPEFITHTTYHIDHIDANSGYQAGQKYKAAVKWLHGLKHGYVWLGMSGAATPVGFGGLVADMIRRGMIDAVVCTGANAYHDLHFAFGLPITHGTDKVDDNKLRKDETTRIYTQYIHNEKTLKMQDALVQLYARSMLKRKPLKLKPPFSTAKFINELGKEILLRDDFGYVKDREGSFFLTAAQYDVPIFLDSGSNHSLAMDLAALSLEGLTVDTSPSRDIIEAAALSLHTQPQTNIFFGEGGPRNFTQTTAPTAIEIMYLKGFEGSDSCVRFTVADTRAGALSGSTGNEAVTWGKYEKAGEETEIEVWGEYTLTAPDVVGWIAGKTDRNPKRLMREMDQIVKEFEEKIARSKGRRDRTQRRLLRKLPKIAEEEIRARIAAGYQFNRTYYSGSKE